jgi:hypothetical protein
MRIRLRRIRIVVCVAHKLHGHSGIKAGNRLFHASCHLLEQTIKYNEPVNISTKDGNAVIISEEDYNGLMETVYFCSIPNMIPM